MSGIQREDEPAHDVLAADEFALPAPDALHHSGAVVLPDDPTGDPAPHDILAAEDFAIPAANGTWSARVSSRRGGNARLVAEALCVVLLVGLLLRRRG